MSIKEAIQTLYRQKSCPSVVVGILDSHDFTFDFFKKHFK